MELQTIVQAILRGPEVRERVGLSRTSIYYKVKQGTFPQPIVLTKRAIGWLESDIDAWIEAQAAAARSKEVNG